MAGEAIVTLGHGPNCLFEARRLTGRSMRTSNRRDSPACWPPVISNVELRPYATKRTLANLAMTVSNGHATDAQGLLSLAADFEDEADRRILFFMLG